LKNNHYYNIKYAFLSTKFEDFIFPELFIVWMGWIVFGSVVAIAF
jgi:hypothetical protein